MAMTKTKIHEAKGYVLGVRCTTSHSGNRRYVLDGAYAACQGCGHFMAAADLPRFASRAEALAADQGFRATWPQDSSADVLAGKRI